MCDFKMSTQIHWTFDLEINHCREHKTLWKVLQQPGVQCVDQKILVVFYQAVFESLMRYGITAWFGNLSVQLKSKLVWLMQTAWKIIGVRQHPSLQSTYEQAVRRQANKIITDPSHALHTEYQLLPAGRRFRVPRCRLNRFKNSFIPTSIQNLNGGRLNKD